MERYTFRPERINSSAICVPEEPAPTTSTSPSASTFLASVIATSSSDTFYVDSGLQGNTTYYYRITSVDDVGNESAYSAEASATPVGVPVWYVSATSGNDITNNGIEAAPFASIQRGIIAAIDGDTVMVAAGTYVENINFSGKNIAVIGEDKATTIIDGNQGGSVVTFANNETAGAVLSEFTIQNGMAFPGYFDSGPFTSGGVGGGIICDGASPVLKNLIIKNNTTSIGGGHGGGIFAINGNISIENCVVKNNTSENGSGIWIYGGSGGSSGSIKNSVIYDNTSGSGSQNSSLCIASASGSNASLINSVIYNNNNIGVKVVDGSTLNIINSIIMNNGVSADSAQILIGGSATPGTMIINHSMISNGQSVITIEEGGTLVWGSGNIDVNPMFVDAANGDYHLSDTSPCISAGASSVTIGSTTYTAPTTDLAGNARPSPAGTVPDIGAYENSNGVVSYSGDSYYVSASSNYGNGSSTYPFPAIQQGIDASSSGDTVSVAAGTYVENINFSGKIISVIGADKETTIIDGNQNGSVVLFENNETNAALLKQFTIRNGSGTQVSGNDTKFGGGLFFYNAAPTISDLIIENNQADNGGGFMTFNGDSPIFKNLLIQNNDGYNGGSAIVIKANNTQVENALIINNGWNSSSGGGVINIQTSGVVKNIPDARKSIP